MRNATTTMVGTVIESRRVRVFFEDVHAVPSASRSVTAGSSAGMAGADDEEVRTARPAKPISSGRKKGRYADLQRLRPLHEEDRDRGGMQHQRPRSRRPGRRTVPVPDVSATGMTFEGADRIHRERRPRVRPDRRRSSVTAAIANNQC